MHVYFKLWASGSAFKPIANRKNASWNAAAELVLFDSLWALMVRVGCEQCAVAGQMGMFFGLIFALFCIICSNIPTLHRHTVNSRLSKPGTPTADTLFVLFGREVSAIRSKRCPNMVSGRWSLPAAAPHYDPLGPPRLINAIDTSTFAQSNHRIYHLICPLSTLFHNCRNH
jgi:hypothetical protein